MKSLVITQCTVKKNKDLLTGPAKDMYVGRMFSYLVKKTQEKGDDLIIISAKYGVVLPTKIIEHYNTRLQYVADVDRIKEQVHQRLTEILSLQ